ncbi:MAG: glycosyltransferase family 2 protein [Deltaproteobacteria bacterium]|nr:glycosyltransferase family 2 protein [Deltaproteobacteria bacterium]
MKQKPIVSIAVPLHNEEGNVEPLYREIKGVMERIGLPYEIVLVNDGSTDRTGAILRRLKPKDRCLRVIELAGNFGEAAALSAGFHYAQGDWIINMDGDGQNDPRAIPVFVQKLQEGYRAVTGWRRDRKESYWIRVLPSRVANWMISQITGVRVHDNGCGFKGYESSLVRGFSIPHGFHRFLPALFGVKGREVAEVRVRDRRRQHGTSHYGFGRTIEVIRELATIRFVISDARRWYGWFQIIRLVTVIAAVLSLCYVALFPRELNLIIFLLINIVNLFSWSVSLNLRRFLRSHQEGVFRGKEI